MSMSKENRHGMLFLARYILVIDLLTLSIWIIFKERILLLEVIGSKKAQNLMLLDILNYIIKGTVIFSGWSYIISWQKKNRFRLVFETLLSALNRWYMHVFILSEIGKVTCSKTFDLNKNDLIMYISI